MRKILFLALPLAGCGGSGLGTSRAPNGETIVGNDVSVQVSGTASPTVALELARTYRARRG